LTPEPAKPNNDTYEHHITPTQNPEDRISYIDHAVYTKVFRNVDKVSTQGGADREDLDQIVPDSRFPFHRFLGWSRNQVANDGFPILVAAIYAENRSSRRSRILY